MVVALYPYDIRLTRTRWARCASIFGIISYTLYLIHVPISIRVFNIGERLTGLQGWRWLAYAAVAFAFTMVVGTLFFRYCERPWLNVKPAEPANANPPRGGVIFLEKSHNH